MSHTANTGPARILVVDDDPDILELLSYNLKKEGYEVREAGNGKEALKLAPGFRPDLILLDVMMPEMDGITTCQEMRRIPSLKQSYIIFLTARIEEYSEIAGFSAGADDYITKPIKPGALLSRIQAIMKRRGPDTPRTNITSGNLVIDKTSYEVTYKGEKLHFARKEFELLYMLASQPGKVFTREDILERIWGTDVFVGDRTVDVHIRKIREKIDPDSIKTIKGIGYKFEA
jgi:two-component system, OmpR family, alkaline phosphatase synthesis response regulator PhoP